jgi:hypothetical protein
MLELKEIEIGRNAYFRLKQRLIPKKEVRPLRGQKFVTCEKYQTYENNSIKNHYTLLVLTFLEENQLTGDLVFEYYDHLQSGLELYTLDLNKGEYGKDWFLLRFT